MTCCWMEDQQEVETGVWTNKRTQRDHWQPIVFVHAPLHFDKKNTDAITDENTDTNTDANTDADTYANTEANTDTNTNANTYRKTDKM